MNPNQQWPAMNWPVPDIIAKYLQIASAADGADADRIAACFTEDGQVTDVDEAIRGTAAIREWWQGPATRFRYSMQVLDGHALGNDRYVVFIRLVGNFPGGVADFAERFTVQDGHIAELDIALRAPGSPAGETSVR